jgi:hypothetical protein
LKRATDKDPLIWNATFILYACYARLGNSFTFVEEAFTSSSAKTVCEAMKLTASRLDPAHIDIRSIRAALNAFESVVTRGLKLVSQTGCWTRGFEHPIGGFFSAVLFILWIRRVEESEAPTGEQLSMLDELRKVLADGDVSIYEESLSATLARASIDLMDQVWIWGITPVMGDAFRLYAEDYLGSRAAIMDVEPMLLEDEQRSEYGD